MHCRQFKLGQGCCNHARPKAIAARRRVSFFTGRVVNPDEIAVCVAIKNAPLGGSMIDILHIVHVVHGRERRIRSLLLARQRQLRRCDVCTLRLQSLDGLFLLVVDDSLLLEVLDLHMFVSIRQLTIHYTECCKPYNPPSCARSSSQIPCRIASRMSRPFPARTLCLCCRGRCSCLSTRRRRRAPRSTSCDLCEMATRRHHQLSS